MQYERLHYRDPLDRRPRDTTTAGREQRFYEQHGNETWHGLRSASKTLTRRVVETSRSWRADLLTTAGRLARNGGAET